MDSKSTFSHQDDVPKLPLPKLQDTFYNYLASVRPFVNDEQYAQTEALVNEFGKPGGIAEELQQYIAEKAKSSDNWVTDWWTDYIYLKNRNSVIFNSSGCIMAGYEWVTTEDEYIDLAAKIALKIVDYYWLIYTQTLPPENFGGRWQCMKQKLYMFGGGRIPKHGIDVFDWQNLGDDISRHIIISHNNRFFAIESIKDNKVITFTEMRMQIKRLIEMSAEVSEPVGILTAAERDRWADVLELLLKDPQNEQSWRTIHRGITVLSLERNLPEIPVSPDHPDYADEQFTIFVAGSLHAYGSKYSAANRWNDKCIANYLGRYGYFGLLGEHSNIDGSPLFLYNSYVEQQISKVKTDDEPPREYLDEVSAPLKIEWNLSEELRYHIQQTAETIDKSVDSLLTRGMIFSDYGKEFIKSQKMSPDSFIQTALQLIYYKLAGQLGSQYESCALRHFVHGRTETIRSATIKSKILCEIWTNPHATDSEKRAAFADATKLHNKIAREAYVGQGWDRHMFGLKIAALEKGLPEPELFRDYAYKKLNQYEVSTSQMTCGKSSNGAFAPSCHHGYGISYSIQPHQLNFSCTSFVSCPTTDSKLFLDKVREFFREYRDMAERLAEANE
ncbi:uncharacterized protein TRIADDRAFT_33379 [Trichoplax adhaerens]|uniref:Choline/carnitine acyltransferase domain-containing protein n=1 Tax=Trichoplax adhaerens TaxID=10228 RepID=B3SCI6_TRIAD|nr:hypothetical protein TRIADDRAFT_33379 [Trichoplax adhaerens]EDV19523.1 hypothetical protein TRIADDRAFT_33379 [Trichoplax adhaerens]|eukprot:XP_002117955.1 hypothetical protein TRIADDRAFT_33379 [Trichoplax adhaerens]